MMALVWQSAKMAYVRRIHLILLLVWPLLTQAQEVKYIEISVAQQRTELRHPPAPPPECKDGTCTSGGFGGGSIGDGAPDQRDPHALAVYLLRVTPTEIRASEPFEAEFKVLNTGKVSIEVPVYSHLSDLQPNDESAPFSYFSLALVVLGESEPEGQGSNVSALGYIELYGSHKHEGTMMELRPGEWIRVRANMKLNTWPGEPVFGRLRGGFWLRKNTFRPQAGGQFTETQILPQCDFHSFNSCTFPWLFSFRAPKAVVSVYRRKVPVNRVIGKVPIGIRPGIPFVGACLQLD